MVDRVGDLATVPSLAMSWWRWGLLQARRASEGSSPWRRAWQDLVARGEMSEQTLSRFGQLLHRFEAFATVRGAPLVTDLTPAIAGQFVDAHGRTRHGHVAPASLSTRHLRRSVLRMRFSTARRLGLTDTDPARDLDLPPRVTGETRSLDEAEAVELRLAAEFTDPPHPARRGRRACAAPARCRGPLRP
ncbi:hypothetical protein [Streptomyces sp. NPDC002845]